MRARDVGDLVLVGAIWGGSFPLLKVAAPQFGPVALITVRLLAAAILLLSVWRVFAQLRAHRGRLLVLGLINTAVPFTLFAYAALSVSAGINSLLNATTPLFAAIISWLWLGERVAPLRLLGIAIAFTGIVLIVMETLQLSSFAQAFANSSVIGILAGLSAGALYGLSACYTRRYLGDLSPTVLATGSVTNATLMLMPLSLLFLPPQVPTPGAWGAAIVLGVVCTALAYILYFRLVQNIGPSRAVTVTFLIPVFGILWGTLFLNERLPMTMLLNCAVVLFGTALATGVLGRSAVPAR